MVENSVGLQARKIRQQRGETLEQVSERAGLSLNQLSRIERGESNPTERTIRTLAKALEVPVSFLFGEIPEGTATEKVDGQQKKSFLDDLPEGVTQELLEYLADQIAERMEQRRKQKKPTRDPEKPSRPIRRPFHD